MTDPILELLEQLPSARLDASRANRIRTRCHAALVHERHRARARAISSPRPAVRRWPLIAVALPIDIPPVDAPYELPAGWAPPPLPPLTIPTLVIWAMDDLALPPENLEGLDKAISDLTVVEVPDCGHFVPWEAPAAVNAAMDEFFTRTG